MVRTKTLKVVRFAPQTLSIAEKQQARANVGAASSEVEERGYINISTNNSVVAIEGTASSANGQVLYSSNDHNTLEAGYPGMAGFQMNLKEYAEAVLAKAGLTNRTVLTVSFAKIGIATDALTGTNLVLKIYKGTTQLVATSDSISNSTQGSSYGVVLSFPFSTPVELEADAVYYFYIYSDGTRIGGGGASSTQIRLAYSTQLRIPSFYLCTNANGSGTKRGEGYVFKGQSEFNYRYIPSIELVQNVNAKTGAVALTGADIAVSTTDATRVDTALATKLDKSGGTMTGNVSTNENYIFLEGSNSGAEGGRAWIAFFGLSIANPDKNKFSVFYEHKIVRYSADSDDPYSILFPTFGGTLALLENLAPDYDSTATYVTGQLVKESGLLKICTTAGVGSAAVFANATVEDAFASLRSSKADATHTHTASNITDFAAAVSQIAPPLKLFAEFSESSTYAVDDRVMYNGSPYICTTAVTTAGVWTGATNWAAYSYDFSTNQDIVKALEDVVAVLGGVVTNSPTSTNNGGNQ